MTWNVEIGGLPFPEHMAFVNTPAYHRRFVACLALSVGARVAVETGTAEGGTAAALAWACDRVISIDVDGKAGSGLREFPELAAKVELVTGDSIERLTPAIQQSPELFFHDSDHNPDHVIRELAIMQDCRTLKAIAIHDAIGHSGLREAVEGWSKQSRFNPMVFLTEPPGLAFWIRPELFL